jgi:ssDNA-binding Zn-finger/Zn-ribbon topoisomerase 1
MVRDEELIGECPQCRAPGLCCRFNRFQKDDLQILSWEHRCNDCGHRETKAYRSDEPDTAGDLVDQEVCPYCSRHARPDTLR